MFLKDISQWKKIIKFKNSWFCKVFLMLLIFRCKTENWSDKLSRKLRTSPGIKYGVSRLWNVLLKKLTSGLPKLSKRISVLSDIFYFKVSKFLVSLSYFSLVFAFILKEIIQYLTIHLVVVRGLSTKKIQPKCVNEVSSTERRS